MDKLNILLKGVKYLLKFVLSFYCICTNQDAILQPKERIIKGIETSVEQSPSIPSCGSTSGNLSTPGSLPGQN